MKAVRWLAVAAMIGVTTSPAVAAGELELSRDGTSWSPDLSEPLFDSNVRWVPGDIRSSSFFVRNLTSQQGRLSMDILDTAATELIDTGNISIDAQGAGGLGRRRPRRASTASCPMASCRAARPDGST